MKILNYKQYEVVISSGGNCVAKIYKGSELVDKIKFIYFTKNQVLQSIKNKIDLLEVA
jgi:hypothetical protein